MHSTCNDRLTKAAKRYVSPGTRPLTTAEQDLAVKLMKDRKWIASYRQPVTERVRWYATEQGKMAYASL